MKLPGINYRTPVQRLGRRSVGGALSAGMAQASALTAASETMLAYNKSQAVAQYNDAYSQYEKEMQEAEFNLTAQQYEQTEGITDPADLQSRHSVLLDQFDETEKQIRKASGAQIDNSLAARKFTEQANGRTAQSRNSMIKVSGVWAKTDANIKVTRSIDQYMTNNDFAKAEQAFLQAAQQDILTKKQVLEYPILIKRQEAYVGYTDSLAAAETADERLAVEKQASESGILTDRQKKGINSEVNAASMEGLANDMADTLRFAGAKFGEDAFRFLNAMTPEQLGFTGQAEKYTAMTRLQGMVQDYYWREEKEAKVDKSTAIRAAIWAGLPQGQGENGKERDEVFAIKAADNPPFSPVWNTTALQEGAYFGSVAPEVMKQINGYMAFHDPKAVIAASQFVRELRIAAPLAAEFDKKTIALAEQINFFANDKLTPEIIEKFRVALNPNQSEKDLRQKVYNNMKPEEIAKYYKDGLAAMETGSPFWKLWSNELDASTNVRAQEYFGMAFENNFLISGDAQNAARLTFSDEMRKRFTVSKATGETKYVENGPESMVPKGQNPDGSPADWVARETKIAAEQYGLDLDDVTLQYMPTTNPPTWLVLERDENGSLNIVLDEDGNMAALTYEYDKSAEGVEVSEAAAARLRGAEIEAGWARDRELNGHPIYGKGPRESIAPAINLFKKALKNDLGLLDTLLDQLQKLPHNKFERRRTLERLEIILEEQRLKQ